MSRETKEKKALLLYNQTLKQIIYPVLGKTTTWSHDLEKLGHKLFQRNFSGVFSSDKLPEIGRNRKGKVNNKNITSTSPLYAIVNMDNSSQPGSHWLALAYDINTQKIYVYDSFGRPTKKIIPSVIKKYGKKNLKMADNDAEQGMLETDCGSRCLAFIWVFDRVGSDFAKLI